MRHPCQSGHRCTCHSAGPSNKTTTSLIIAALVAPVLAAPAPVALPFLYPTLQRRVTDAGQAPDDPSEGFAPEHIQLSDLRKAGLPYKFVYDPTAEVARDVVAGVDVDIRESSGAWVIDDAWQMHGKRFGPLSATATADITDDPLPTQTEAVATASSSATATTTSLPTVLAIESTLPTGWADDAYRRSGMYAIPLVVSFSVVIALMIGSLIGALAIRRDRSRSRRRKKRLVGDDDSVTREKVVRKGLAARVGRALKLKEKSHTPRQTSPRPEAEAEPERDDVEVGEHAAEAQRDRSERSELEKRVKSWARRSASWKVQARVGMRRRMGRGKKRVTADNDLDNVEVIREDREGEERVEREEAEADARSRTGSRAPTPVERTSMDRSLRAEDPTPYAASSPVVPTYSSTSSSSAAGPSTPRDPRGAGDVNDAHADAAPSDEPAYDDPGAGDGLPPAYRRGEARAEIRRGKMPMRSSSPDVEPEAEVEVRRQEPEQPRAWTALDAYAFGGTGEEVGEAAVTAHVATDDKRVLERLQSMRGAPEEEVDGQGGEAPREEDVFVVDGQESGSSGSLPEASVLPSPPTKAGAGPVARYDEADLSLPRYLDGAGSSCPAAEMVPSAPPEDVPSAPPAESVPLDVPSAPPLEDDDKLASAPPLDENLVPSAPPMDDDPAIPTPTSSIPSAPTLHHTDSSSPLLRE